MKPVQLALPESQRIISAIPGKFTQAIRMVEYLANHPGATTQQVASDCAIGNLSDVAHKANPHIYKAGYFIGCQRPVTPINNRFGEPSGMFLWGLYQVHKAANDDDYGVDEGAEVGNAS